MKSAPVAASSSGDNQVVAAVPGRRVAVFGFCLSFSGNVNAKWKSGASTDLTGLLYGAAAAQVVVPVGPSRPGGPPEWFSTAAGEALVLNLSGAVAVGGVVLYQLVD